MKTGGMGRSGIGLAKGSVLEWFLGNIFQEKFYKKKFTKKNVQKFFSGKNFQINFFRTNFLKRTKRHNIVDYVEEWMEIGFQWFGGCCRVTPNEISQIKNLVIKS